MERGTDISKLSLKEFGAYLYMSTVLRNGLDGGLSYLNPAFRELEGQMPLDMKKYTLVSDGIENADLAGMKELAERTPEHIAYVLRSPSGGLLGVFHVPAAKSSGSPQLKIL